MYGAGDADRPPLKSHRLHGQADLSEIIKLMGRARMTLNVGPNFCNGSHERVFSAMLNGALAVTDANAYWRGEFMEGEGILMYEWARLSELAGKIEYFLSRPAELSEATEAGAQKARENHTALNRARRMLEIVDMVGKTPPPDAETL